MNGRTAFVTGGTGFLGINLIRALVEQAWDVTALHRASSDITDLKALPIHCAIGDILDPAGLERAIPESVDVVFHIAGDTSLWVGADEAQTRVNVEGTQNVVNAAVAKHAKRFVHTSTTSAYGRHAGVVSESTPSNAPDSKVNYEKSKWQGEQIVHDAVRQRGLNAVVLNPAAILGPYDRHTWARVFYMIRDGKIPALPPGKLSFNHVREIVKAHIAAVEIGAAGEQYILAGETMALADLMRKMGKLMGCKVPSIVAPALGLQITGWFYGLLGKLTGIEPDITPETAAFMAKSHLYDWSKAQAQLGLQASDLDECLQDSYDWLKARGLL